MLVMQGRRSIWRCPDSSIIYITCQISLLALCPPDPTPVKYCSTWQRLKQRVCLAVLPDAVQSFGRILSAIEQMDGAIISKVEALGLTSDTAAAAPECLARVLPDRGSILAVEVLTDSRQGGWQGWAGVVKDLKADYGEGIYAPGSVEELSEVGPFLFQPHQSFTGGSDESEPCSLCMVKPHVMRERQLGNLVSGILDEGFRIGAMKLLHLSTATAEELLGVYKEVVDGYTSMLEECTVAPVLALQVLPGVSTADPERLIDDFRAYCGPSDPQVAKAIRPDTIRAKFGQGLHKNAVHCTDLHEDGALECKYIFCIVPRALMA
ncbi:unnamed protein product [Chrysoparadoxa australica]